MSVAILGCGPAGLMAALATETITGKRPAIYSKKVKSTMPGAIYLHEPIPGLCHSEPDFQIYVLKDGNREGYAQKVYGDKYADCSWDDFDQGSLPAWDMGLAYEKLWTRYQGDIRDIELDNRAVGAVLNNYTFVFSSIPARLLCSGGHSFEHKKIWITHGPQQDELQFGNNLMWYMGDITVPWYRYSQINDYQSWEFSVEPVVKGPNHYETREGVKPISTNCDCWMSWQNFYRIGRFGQWTKGVLVHHAYRDVVNILSYAVQ